MSTLLHRGKPRLLDLFCCEGGAGMGYHRAGFDVTGVDLTDHSGRYPFTFHLADALTFPLDGFDAIHASPPCQANIKGLNAVNAALGRTNDHVDLIDPIRDRLQAAGLPYVIENVIGAELHNPVQLCGSSFGLAVRRHRLFECNFPLMAPPCAHHLQREAKYWTGWMPNGERRRATSVQVYGNAGEKHEWSAAMGIDWMTDTGLAEAIPPAYTEYIGGNLLSHIQAQKASHVAA
jgi:DNA (cytosine-5)-methyltransferase 1